MTKNVAGAPTKFGDSMNCFLYDVYYEKCPADVDRTPLTDSDVAAVLTTFPANLHLHLAFGGPTPALADPSDATVKTVVPFYSERNQTSISVDTVIDEEKVDAAVDEVAKSHGLSWRKISRKGG